MVRIWRRVKRFFVSDCEHRNVRCVHGAELMATHRYRKPTIARVMCLDCNKYQYNMTLPVICTETGKIHFSRRTNNE